MTKLKLSAGILALACTITFLSSCGPAGSTSRSDEPKDARTQLAAAPEKITAALSNAGVSQTQPTASGCSLSSAAGSDPSALFANLESEIEAISQDVQNQTDLSSDLQTFQAGLMNDISDLLAQIQACIPQQSMANNPQGGVVFPGSSPFQFINFVK